MPEQEPIPTEEAPEESAAAAGRSSILAKIKILVFVTVVITLECLVAYALLPDAAQTTAMVEAMLAADPDAAAPPVQDEQQDLIEEPLMDQVEVDLGEFDVSAFQPVSETTLRITFHLWGTVAKENQDGFFKLMDGNQNRFREQVLVTVRSVDIADLADAGLGLVKRKLLERANKTLGKPLLRTIIFSDFSFIEQ